jgi:hypothetical protein
VTGMERSARASEGQIPIRTAPRASQGLPIKGFMRTVLLRATIDMAINSVVRLLIPLMSCCDSI